MGDRTLGLAGSVVRADLRVTDIHGRYTIEAAGFRVTNGRCPVNRMAKVLFDHGHRGHLEAFGPSADGSGIIHRMSVNIETEAAHQLTETSAEGFRRIPWTQKSLVALRRATERIRPFEQSDFMSPEERDATTAPVGSSGVGIGSTACPLGTDPPSPDENAPAGVCAPSRGDVLTQSTAKKKGPQT